MLSNPRPEGKGFGKDGGGREAFERGTADASGGFGEGEGGPPKNRNAEGVMGDAVFEFPGAFC